MAKKTSTAVQVYSAKLTGKDYDVKNYDKVLSQIREMAAYPNPNNRYEIAQMAGFIVDYILGEKLTYIERISDLKKVGYGEKAQFKIKVSGIKAFIQAKGSTTERSKIAHEFVTLNTKEVSARPVINFSKLSNGQQTMEEVIEDAVIQMEQEMLMDIENTCYTAFSALSSPNYGAGSGIIATTLKPLINAMGRFGRPSIFGDMDIISKLAAATGFDASSSVKQYADSIMEEQNASGFIGVYNGADVIKIANQYKDETSLESSNLVLKNDLLYIVPAGAKDKRPLKVAFEGDVRNQEQQNIDDESWEIVFRKNFGAGVVASQKLLSIYEDTSL
jgi:hypothetical protein